ncbi:MAG: T9SS type A sorting domain-containing protein [Ferruginibacter sp.]|nr:T9SS type A sorting domain-containing protein [Ferruginibacter sp.]
MKRVQLTLVGILAVLVLNAQLPPFQWVNKMVGGNSKTLAIDPLGNVYSLGNIGPGSTRDVDPGPGIYNLFGGNGTNIIYKVNTAGQFIWAKQLPSGVTPEFLKSDAAGNVYLVGLYNSTSDFDPGPAVFNLTSVAGGDIFTLKLDSAGNFLWAKSQGGNSTDIGYGIAISTSGNVYTAGLFSGTCDFDPGVGVYNMGGVGPDTYISALDAAGNFLWAKHIAEGSNGAHSISTNTLGDIVIAGVFSGTKDFDTGAGVFNITSSGSADIFILKLDGLGNFVWAKAVGGIGIEGDEAVTLDPLGNVYITGSFGFTADFDPGPAVFNLTVSGGLDIFVLKLNVSGGFVWAKQMSGLLTEKGYDITTDAAGNVYTTGIFEDVADFDPGAGVFNLTTKGSRDIFISKLTTDGNFGWAVGFGETTSEDAGNAIAVDAAGSVYTTGTFLGQIDFDPGPGTAILIDINQSIFVHKFGPGVVLPLTLLHFTATAAANGNVLHWQTSQEINTKQFEIEWGYNGQTFVKIALQKAAGNSSALLNYDYLHTAPVNGDNYYRLKMVDMDGKFTYSKIVRIKTTITLPVITIFPNPVTDQLKMNILASKTETILFYLRSADGKLVSSRYLNLIKGSNLFNWNLQAVPAGKYFISSGNDQFQTIPVIKQ